MIPHALEGGYKVVPWLYDGFWMEIGSLKSFYDINLALAKPNAPLSVDAIHRGILSRGACSLPAGSSPAGLFRSPLLREVACWRPL